jgi:hypothetical protein
VEDVFVIIIVLNVHCISTAGACVSADHRGRLDGLFYHFGERRLQGVFSISSLIQQADKLINLRIGAESKRGLDTASQDSQKAQTYPCRIPHH